MLRTLFVRHMRRLLGAVSLVGVLAAGLLAVGPLSAEAAGVHHAQFSQGSVDTANGLNVNDTISFEDAGASYVMRQMANGI
jgi:hypothetical protein